MFRALLALASLLLSSLSLSDDTLRLRLLTWQGYAPIEQLRTFEQKIEREYGRKLTFDVSYVSSSDDYFEQIRLNNVDIIVPSANVVLDSRYKMIERALIIPMDLEQIPNFHDVRDEILQRVATQVGEQHYYIPFIYGPYGLAYDTFSSVERPRSWLSFWDPLNAQKYSISKDYYEANIYITALAAGLNYREVSNVNRLNTARIKKMLKQLVRNSRHLWSGVDTSLDLRGNQLATSWGINLNASNEDDKRWEIVCPKEGTPVWIDGYALTRELAHKPLHKRIAEQFINYSLSEQYQRDVVYKQLDSLPVNLPVFEQLARADSLPAHERCIDLSFTWPVLSFRQRNFMRSLWFQALRD
ncbi:MAG: ABC transporter substrate-binding protein [Pseudomonadales bacterium]